MSQPATVKKLQSSLEDAMDQLQRTNLIPIQKESFLCAAKCCDKHQDMQALQQCTVDCQRKIQGAHQIMYGTLEDFQKRFQRCLMRCEDTVKDSLPANPSKNALDRAEEKIMRCMDACADEYTDKVPKLKSDVVTNLSQLK